MTNETFPAGWLPDPENAAQLRFWDGVAWTEHVHAAAPKRLGNGARCAAHVGGLMFPAAVPLALRSNTTDADDRAEMTSAANFQVTVFAVMAAVFLPAFLDLAPEWWLDVYVGMVGLLYARVGIAAVTALRGRRVRYRLAVPVVHDRRGPAPSS